MTGKMLLIGMLLFTLSGCDKVREASAEVNPGAFGSGRCASYVQTVRVEHIKHFGLQFPYWYSVGQLYVESNCRETVTAFDQGQGIAQFMPKTSKYIRSLMGEELDPYNPKHAIRMQAFYMNRIHTAENWTERLWVDFQIYNGGRAALYKEFLRAGMTDWDLMKDECRRNRIQFTWGVLDLCAVNYEYSKKVEQHGRPYSRGAADGMRYW